MVILNGSQFIEEIKGVPENIFSARESSDEVCVVNSMHDSGF